MVSNKTSSLPELSYLGCITRRVGSWAFGHTLSLSGAPVSRSSPRRWSFRRGTRKAARRYPVEAHAAQARDVGFTWWQWWIMTPLTLIGTFWVFGLLSGLPMFLYVMYAQLTQL